jgi:aminopeptidase-like protein
VDISNPIKELDFQKTGQQLHAFIRELYPICRSITGNGLRRTLKVIQDHIPVTLREVPTGTQVFDWTVPREWNIRDAYVKNDQGLRVIDFNDSSLHVLNYSIPVQKTITLEALKPHLYSLPEHPDWIPYRTSYYKENWGFCLSHNELLKLDEGEYEVCIDSSLQDGSMTLGELYLPGEIEDEVLISCHTCHPSLCNDNLSGVAIAVFLAKHIQSVAHRYSWRFLFIPGTIGSIAWLALNEERTEKIKHGLILACLGDSGKMTYKRSRRGNSEIDRIVKYVLRTSGNPYQIEDFSPYGYDERQFCSPGFNLPVGCLSRTPHGCFPEYHTSADNLEFVQASALEDSFSKILSILSALESNRTYKNLQPKCEPQLGKRGLYRTTGGRVASPEDETALLWVLNFSDGQHSILDIAERSCLDFNLLKKSADILIEHGLIAEE